MCPVLKSGRLLNCTSNLNITKTTIEKGTLQMQSTFFQASYSFVSKISMIPIIAGIAIAMPSKMPIAIPLSF